MTIDFAILAGGQSRRFGAEKANLPFGQSTLLEAVVNRLREIRKEISPESEIMIVKKPESEVNVADVKIIDDSSKKDGALIGVHTALIASATDKCFIFACDTPFLSRKLICKMLGMNDAYDALVPIHKKGIEPLHAIYSRRCLKAIDLCIEMESFSAHSMLKRVNTRFIQAKQFCDPEVAFININTMEDYKRAFIKANSNKVLIKKP
ncbi:MAG: molybdenum cofactor guanylyltransferase [Candidatus Thermoplasmatota archaeon]|nr:molybdenum cofactor guanylyltransferase [Candidatus Thermoplasmatota archaeon]